MIRKKRTVALYILAFIPVISIFAGEREGGGGGGVSINGKIYTFAEAGLKIEDSVEDPFYLDTETIEETQVFVKKLDKNMPSFFRGKIGAAIFSNDHVYLRASITSPEFFEKVKEEYVKYLGSVAGGASFVLAAYTEGKTTYLFPDFFKAEPKTRALYMLHEAAFYLNPKADLKDVLRWEISAYNYLEKETLNSRIDLYKSLINLEILSKNTYLKHTAFYLLALQKEGIEINLSHVISENIASHSRRRNDPRWDCELETDAVVLRRSKALEKSFFRRFFRSTWILSNCIRQRQDYSLDTYKIVVDEDVRITIVPKGSQVEKPDWADWALVGEIKLPTN